MIQVLILKNSLELREWLRSHHKHELQDPGLPRDSYKYIAMSYCSRWYKYRTSSVESQYLPEHRVIGNLGTLHQIELLKSLGLKDPEIWNQLKELT